MGARGRIEVDMDMRMAMWGFVVLLIYHCFMWFVEFGGSVIVE